MFQLLVELSLLICQRNNIPGRKFCQGILHTYKFYLLLVLLLLLLEQVKLLVLECNKNQNYEKEVKGVL